MLQMGKYVTFAKCATIPQSCAASATRSCNPHLRRDPDGARPALRTTSAPPYTIGYSIAETAVSRRLTEHAQSYVAACLGEGAVAVDATAGKGADTAFLAAAVGRNGLVHAFDVQTVAIERARQRLAERDLAQRVVWHHADHAAIPDKLGDQPIAVAMFNLGWLPGGDRELTTVPASTLAALDAAARLLQPGGRLSILAYRGHPGGETEANAVAQWAAQPHHGLTCHERIASGTRERPGPVFYGLVRG